MSKVASGGKEQRRILQRAMSTIASRAISNSTNSMERAPVKISAMVRTFCLVSHHFAGTIRISDAGALKK
jgi:hypothetical protein